MRPEDKRKSELLHRTSVAHSGTTRLADYLSGQHLNLSLSTITAYDIKAK